LVTVLYLDLAISCICLMLSIVFYCYA